MGNMNGSSDDKQSSAFQERMPGVGLIQSAFVCPIIHIYSKSFISTVYLSYYISDGKNNTNNNNNNKESMMTITATILKKKNK